MPESLLEQFHHGSRRALARLLSQVSRGEGIEGILAGIGQPDRRSRVVAITGSAGVGKSTLVGKLIEYLRGQAQTVAVLACDPQSPLSGGALLGDRFRMTSKPDDDGVFIRSLAAAADQGAVAQHLDVMIRLLEAFGFDLIVIETVGAGQGDTAVRDLADVVVLLVQPETGDDLQWEKAGLLEVADVVAIHKADLPGAEGVESQVRSILGLSSGREVAVLRVSAKSGSGIKELWQVITAFPLRQETASGDVRELLRLAQDMLSARFARALETGDPVVQPIVHQWQQGQLPGTEAGAALLQRLGATPTSR